MSSKKKRNTKRKPSASSAPAHVDEKSSAGYPAQRSRAQALEDVRGYARAGRYRILRHAWEEMAEANARERDVHHALANARSCRLQENGRWRVEGEYLDGEELALVVEIEDGLVVVTVF